MIVEVKVPAVGESVTEGILAAWQVEDGSAVQADEPLFELETDKVTMEVNAEESGRIELLAQKGDTVEIGQVVAKIDTDSAGKEPPAGEDQPAESKARASSPDTAEDDGDAGDDGDAEEDGDKDEEARQASREEKREEEKEKPPSTEEDRGELSGGQEGVQSTARQESEEKASIAMPPSVRRLVREHGLDPEQIAPSSGRLSRSDVMRHLEGSGAQKTSSAEPSQPRTERQTRQKMSPIRRRIAERLLEAQQNAAILTTFNEADMSNVLAWRAQHKEAFQKKHGVRLGFMSFFVKAVVEALRAVPEVNRQIEGEELVQNHYYDIGVAVSSEKGLVVPVVRDADQLSFAGIEKAIEELASKVRDRRIQLSELSGGVFTISNGGVFGSLLSTPILNPPQSGVLGMHAIRQRPVEVEGEMQLRPMMYLALSYDHRVVDGREAVTFLRRIVECIEDPERLLLEM